MKELKLINPENISEEEAKNYSVREAARAVVVDTDGKIALLYVSKSNYHKLPGGGIENGEDRINALRRECREEIGCEIDIVGEIGFALEYKKMDAKKQISYCYLAKVKGEKRTPEFVDYEIEEGFESMWVPYKEALEIMNETKTTNHRGGLYIVPRDMAFLKEAKILLDKIIN